MKRVFPITIALLSFFFSQSQLQAQLINLVEPTFLVNAPAAVAGVKTITRSHDGTAATNNWGRMIDSFWYNVPIAKPNDTLGCTIPAGSMTGKFAFIYRGDCMFSEKAYRAQLAGAIGVVIVNNIVGGPAGMAGGTNSSLVTIPVVMISKVDGDAINAQLRAGQSVSVSLTNWGFGFDHDLGIVNNSLPLFHAYAIPKYELSSGTPTAYKTYTGGYVANLGSNTENNVKLRSTVSFTPSGGTSSVIDRDTLTINTITTNDSVVDIFASAGRNLSAINQKGTLSFAYNLSSNVEDLQPTNNTMSFDVAVTDSIYSKGRIDLTTGAPKFTIGYRFNSSFTNTWGPLFYVREGGHKAVKAQFSVSDGEAGSNLSGKSVNFYLFKWTDNNTNQVIETGELEISGGGAKVFSDADTNYMLYTAELESFDIPGDYAYLSGDSWYWLAAEVTNDLYLACDGDINYFNRSNAASRTTPATAEYWAPQYQGGFTDLTSADPNSNIVLYPFEGTGANILDSVSYLSSKGLVPAITLHTSQSFTNVKTIKKNTPVVNIYPNPADNFVNIGIDIKSKSSKVFATIIDGIGRIVYKSEATVVNNKADLIISTNKFEAGNYFLIIRTNIGEVISKTFTVIK